MISQRKTNNADDTTQIRHNASTIDAKLKRTTSSGDILDIEKQSNGKECHESYRSSCEKNTNGKGVKLIIGVCGIYVTYLYYGTLQEEVYTYPGFHYVWFVQVIESFTNMMGAHLGRYFLNNSDSPELSTADTNKKYRTSHYLFALCGTSQICSKALISMSLNSGLSYPIATLAKSGRMAPVMIGQLLLGNSKYSTRDYAQVLCIIAGTAILGLSKNENTSAMPSPTTIATYFIIMSLVMDGITGGLQKKIKEDAKAKGENIKGFDFMFFTNLYMLIVSILVAVTHNQLMPGFHVCILNPELQRLIGRFCICSAAGQSFIYFTIANFDPLVCSTVTTTRKIVSVLLSIWYRGHVLNHQGWSGILLAFTGIALELQHKFQRARVNEKKNLKG